MAEKEKSEQTERPVDEAEKPAAAQKPAPEEGSAKPEQPKAAGAKKAGSETAGKKASLAERKAAPAGPATAVVAPTGAAGATVVSRRSVLRFGFWSGMGAAIAGLAAITVDMLWPRNVSGFGGKVTVSANDIPPPGGKREIPAGRFWLVHLTEEQGASGLLALWWKCPHLGCTVPWKPKFVWPDQSGQPRQGWFRCPCHGSTYTDAGVIVFGPAPRSMDTMALTVDSSGAITVDTGNVTNGATDNADRAVRL